MNTKSKIARIRRIALTLFTILGVFFSVGMHKSSVASALGSHTSQITPPEIVLIPGTVTVSADVEEAIKLALANASPVLGEGVRYFAVTDVRKSGNWEFVSIIGLVQYDETVGWFLEEGSWFGVVLLQDDGKGNWQGVTEGTIEFSKMLQTVPDSILGPVAKQNIELSSSAVDASTNYRFPWQSGTSMFYGSLGVHSNGFSGVVTGWNAVDMLSDGNTGAGHAPNRLLASETASISYVCNDGTSVAVRMGNFFYTHLLNNSNLYYGKAFNQGDEMGQMKSGTFSANCGYANQGTGWFHVHWGFPAGDLQVEAWTLSISTQNWTNGTTTVTPGNGWITAGVSCPAPSLSAPSDNYTSGSQTISFSWSPVSGCSFNGYTFRIKDTSNMDSGGTTIRDTGVGGTSWTETIDSQYNNRDLYWGVRAANAPQGANWAVRKFRIGGQCPTVSGIARLYDGQNCSGASFDAGLGLSQLELNNFNDMAESIAVPGGWSARLYLHNSESSPSACFTSTDTNLGDNTFSDGTNVANQATWVRVYANTSCAQVDPPPAPVPTSPANGQSFNEGESITLVWSATGNEYYGEVAGGPAGTIGFGWQTGTSKIIGAQWAGYVYSWRVKARNSAGESPWTFAPTFTVFPGRPSNLAASIVSCSQINLSWSDNSGSEEGYKVYRNGNLIATLGSNVTSYPDTGLTGSTSYQYTVKAFRGSIESGLSNSVPAATIPCPLAMPANFRVIDSTQTSITIGWDDVSGETGYKIYEWNGASFVYLASVGANATSYIDARNACGWDQFYEVSAYNSNGESPHAGWVHGYTQPCPFNKITPTNGSANQITGPTLSWESSAGASSYEYCYDNTNDDACANWISNGTSTTVTLNGLSAITTYYWQVRAINPGGTTFANSAPTAFWSFTTQNTVVGCPSTFSYWKGEYWTNTSFTGTSTVCRDDPEIYFDWGYGSPDPLIPADGFSVRWTRTVYFASGTYHFYLGHDDGASLFIDDMVNPVLDKWTTCCVVDPLDKFMTEGNHVIKVEYFENGGAANAQLWWELMPPVSNTSVFSPSASTALSGGDKNGYEVSPTNAFVDDGLFAADNNSGTGTSTSYTDKKKDSHVFYNYGISLPSNSTVQGIEILLDAKVDSTAGAPKVYIQLSWNGGSTWTTAKATSTLSTTEQTYVLGGSADTWGHVWTATDLSNTNFRVRIIDVASNISRDFSLDTIAVRVTYK